MQQKTTADNENGPKRRVRRRLGLGDFSSFSFVYLLLTSAVLLFRCYMQTNSQEKAMTRKKGPNDGLAVVEP
jgi:hypothetical protein